MPVENGESTSPPSRTRTLSLEEQNRLFDALKPRRHDSNCWVLFIVQFALETAMRQGEILSLRWIDIDLVKRTAHLKTSKNGDSRTVPMSTRAAQILQTIPRSLDGRVFPMNKAALAASFSKACKRAAIEDLRFHDLRHTAITNIADKFSNILELSAVTGHRQLSMLKRYYHPKAEDLALKLG